MKSVKKFLRKWHRRIGITLAIFLLNLSITGIILNHYEVLSLHTKMIKSSWLLDWYGVKYPEKISCITLLISKVETKFCNVDNIIYHIDKLNRIRELTHNQGNLINVYSNSPEFILVTSHSVIIFDEKFNLVDSIDIVEERFSSISSSLYFENQLFLQTEKQSLLLELTSFDIHETNDIHWPSNKSTQTKVYQLKDKTIKQSVGQAYRQKQISQLKFFQDLHSGQLFFRTGKLLTDLVAILTIFLVISSLITWRRRVAKM